MVLMYRKWRFSSDLIGDWGLALLNRKINRKNPVENNTAVMAKILIRAKY